MLYNGKTGADPTPAYDTIHLFGFALEDGLHTSIREISHPAGHVIPDGFTAGPRTKCNALDRSGYVDVDTFPITLMRYLIFLFLEGKVGEGDKSAQKVKV